MVSVCSCIVLFFSAFQSWLLGFWLSSGANNVDAHDDCRPSTWQARYADIPPDLDPLRTCRMHSCIDHIALCVHSSGFQTTTASWWELNATRTFSAAGNTWCTIEMHPLQLATMFWTSTWTLDVFGTSETRGISLTYTFQYCYAFYRVSVFTRSQFFLSRKHGKTYKRMVGVRSLVSNETNSLIQSEKNGIFRSACSIVQRSTFYSNMCVLFMLISAQTSLSICSMFLTEFASHDTDN